MEWEIIKSYLVQLGIKLILALIILAVGLKLIKFLVKRFSRTGIIKRLDKGLQSFILSFASLALKILVIVCSALVLGIPEASFATLIASVGVALGLAFQGSLSNFAGGLLILIFKPFKAEDVIETKDIPMGKVEEISICYTKLRANDNREIIIPNGQLTNSTIINHSHNTLRRVSVTVSADYKSDIDKIREVLLGCAKESPLILQDPAPNVILASQSESSLDFELRVWCDSKDLLAVKEELTETTKLAFDKNGITIPYPQLDVHLIQN